VLNICFGLSNALSSRCFTQVWVNFVAHFDCRTEHVNVKFSCKYDVRKYWSLLLLPKLLRFVLLKDELVKPRLRANFFSQTTFVIFTSKPSCLPFFSVNESTPTKRRNLAATFVVFCTSFGNVILPLVAYVLPNWRWMMTTLAFASAAVIPTTLW